MIIVGYFLEAVAQLLHFVLTFFVWIMIARAILSWVNPDPNNGIVRFLHGTTDPLIDKVRRYIPPIGMFDMSVLILILAFYFLDTFLVGVIGTYARVILSKVPAAI